MDIICGEKKIAADDIVMQYTNMLYRVALLRMKNPADAEEVVQDTFLRLISYVQKGQKFRDEEHIKAWLLKVAVNRGKSLLSAAWNRKTEGMDAVQELAAPEQQGGYAYAYVLKLPEKYRIAISLFYYEELSTEQIAEIMNTQPSTVRSYLHRGREKLRTMMEEEGYVG